MAKVSFDPIIKWFAGSIGKLVYRRSHNGKVSVYPTPDMSAVKWSQAQKDQRQRMREASKYASAAVADPDIRPIYVQMAMDHNKNPGRPFDMAVSDYYHHGNDLLWKKHMGGQEKPKNWDMFHYAWYFKKQNRHP
ncbi:MAG TPA: hypothetical protein VK206_02135 [Anaerolineales bacterium]|nr:hypothetical protein [Anaerolineales bacterium]